MIILDLIPDRMPVQVNLFQLNVVATWIKKCHCNGWLGNVISLKTTYVILGIQAQVYEGRA